MSNESTNMPVRNIIIAGAIILVIIVSAAIFTIIFTHNRAMDAMIEDQRESNSRLAQQQRIMDNMQHEIELLSTGHAATIEEMAAEIDELQDTIDELVVGLPLGITTDTVLATVRQVAELTTLVHEYTDVTIQDENNFFTRRLLIIRYAGRVRAGIDFDKIGVEVEGYTITVTMPPARIFSHELPFETIEVIRDETGLFTPSNTIPDFVALMEELQRSKEHELIEAGILADAGTNAQATVRQMIYAMIIAQRGNPASFTINFR